MKKRCSVAWLAALIVIGVKSAALAQLQSINITARILDVGCENTAHYPEVDVQVLVGPAPNSLTPVGAPFQLTPLPNGDGSKRFDLAFVISAPGSEAFAQLAANAPGNKSGRSSIISFTIPDPLDPPLSELHFGSICLLQSQPPLTLNKLTVRYTHDALNRITRAEHVEAGLTEYFTFDSVGNRLSYAVAGANQAPRANSDLLATRPGETLSTSALLLLANDSDLDGDLLHIIPSYIASTAGGSVRVTGDTINYTPPPGFVGLDFFTYSVNDGKEESAQITVLVAVIADQEIRSARFTQSGALRVEFRSSPGQEFQIQASSDLKEWTNFPIAVSDQEGVYAIEDPDAAALPMRTALSPAGNRALPAPP